VKTAHTTRLTVAPGTPEVRLLDAERAGLGQPELRAWAQTEAAAADAPHSSRSYRYPYALVAWHDEPVGIDIERVERFDPAFIESICTPSERELPRPETDLDAYLASLWCSKEALAKALGDALRYDPRRLGSPIFWRDGQAGPWHAVSLPVPAGHNGWLCWRLTARQGSD
jgi:hypothetical protein